ncbi:RDD family protein [Pedobacter frigiditerrae]|uniref:RDD family protein n=1 Tax=Pedobacter frigiditerrae TaxID=2530452 RepID=A0A4R0MZA8_9SPHI|nr:RDD family protein [Pedobacter frigiditerrae]TCC92307.1 RDD family protein [Pedobacter frigiditerrae]
MQEYTVVINGKPEGPYALQELQKLNIKPGTFIRKPGMDDYKEAHEFEELREFLGFKFQQTAPQYFASFDQRLMASVIDYFLLMICYVVIVLLAYIFVDQKMFRIGTALFFLILVPVARIVYSSVAEASIKQATIGKRIMDIKVTDLNGSRLTLGNSIGRNLGKIVSNATFGLGYLFCFLNKKQQCLHDIMAETLVTKQRLI